MDISANDPIHLLAIDLDIAACRAVLGCFDGERITLREVHRFTNDPVMLGGTLYWDFLRLFHEGKRGLAAAARKAPLLAMAVSAWSGDFGLLDENGQLLANPVHYTDKRTTGMLAHCDRRIPRERLYAITGGRFEEHATALQLLALRETQVGLLGQAARMLLIPDLMHHFFCGAEVATPATASTTLLFDMRRGAWSHEIIGALGLPERIFPPVIPSGMTGGELAPTICGELDIPPGNVSAADRTGCALIAVPATESDFAFLLTGTQSRLGTELANPLIGILPRQLGFENQCTPNGHICFHKLLSARQESKYAHEATPATDVGTALNGLEHCVAKAYDRLYLIGPQAAQPQYCQSVADACGCEVSAGSPDAVAMGNIAGQLLAMNVLKNLQQARKVVAASYPTTQYFPRRATR